MDKKYQIEKWTYLKQDIECLVKALSGEDLGEKNLDNCSYLLNSILDKTLLSPYTYDIPFIAEEIGLVRVWGIGYLQIYAIELSEILSYLRQHDYSFMTGDDSFSTIIDGELHKIRQFYISKQEYEKGYEEN